MTDRDVVDEIDALVDAQLRQEASGYDHNINQEWCPRCGRHWHGLPLTERVAVMYTFGQFDPEYVEAEDDSPIVCEGPNFIGPLRPRTANLVALDRMQRQLVAAGEVLGIPLLFGSPLRAPVISAPWVLPTDPLPEEALEGWSHLGYMDEGAGELAIQDGQRVAWQGPNGQTYTDTVVRSNYDRRTREWSIEIGNSDASIRAQQRIAEIARDLDKLTRTPRWWQRRYIPWAALYAIVTALSLFTSGWTYWLLFFPPQMVSAYMTWKHAMHGRRRDFWRWRR